MMFERENLQDLIRWTNIVGIFTIVGGALQAIPGLFAFGIGAVPGLISIYLGTRLLKARDRAKDLLVADVSDAEVLNEFVASLTSYFKVQGVLIILGIIGAILGVLFVMSMASQLMANPSISPF